MHRFFRRFSRVTRRKTVKTARVFSRFNRGVVSARTIPNSLRAVTQRPFLRILAFGLLGSGLVLTSVRLRKAAEAATKESPLFEACTDGDLDKLKSFGNPKVLVNLKHPGGWHLLHSAAVNGHLHIVKWLVENGADVNLQDTYKPVSIEHKRARSKEFSSMMTPTLDCTGWTPLHYAVAFGNDTIVEYLLKNGADPKIANTRGNTPIAYNDKSSDSAKAAKIHELFSEHVFYLEKQSRLQYPLEQKLAEVMIGQAVPILNVSNAIRRKQNGWHDTDKPLVFLFLGSSGVGKTMLAKTIAKYLVQDPVNGFLRFDMSEYSMPHEVSKFIGAPPGYVGYQEGGQLTEKLKKCPNAVVLLDEVEKAHNDVLTVLLQVFDEGRLTDGRGNTIDCKDAIFVMTSNLVQDELQVASPHIRPSFNLLEELKKLNQLSLQQLQSGGDQRQIPLLEDKPELRAIEEISHDFMRKTVQPILKDHFRRDEFLGRIDEIVLFHSFVEADIDDIVNSELDKWKERAVQRHKVHLSWDTKSTTGGKGILSVLGQSFNPSYGFRSIKHEVEKKVINKIARAFERDEIVSGSYVHVRLGKDGHSIKIEVQEGPPAGETGEGGGGEKDKKDKKYFFF